MTFDFVMHNLPQILAIMGPKRSGKDTIASILHDYNYINIKISSKLKEVCKILFGFTDEQLECDIKDSIDPKWGVSPRQAMQFIGTEVMQYKIQELITNINRTFWVKSTCTKIDEHLQNGDRIIITDLRFLHEYALLKERYLDKIVFIRVTRTQNVECDCDHHESEQEWKKIPHTISIINDGTKEDLRENIEAFLNINQIK